MAKEPYTEAALAYDTGGRADQLGQLRIKTEKTINRSQPFICNGLRPVFFLYNVVEVTLEDYLRDNPDKTEADFAELKTLWDEIYFRE